MRSSMRIRGKIWLARETIYMYCTCIHVHTWATHMGHTCIHVHTWAIHAYTYTHGLYMHTRVCKPMCVRAIHAYTCMQAHVCTCMQLYTCMHVRYMHVQYMHIRVCMYGPCVYVYACTVRVYTCMDVCYMCLRVCMFLNER